MIKDIQLRTAAKYIIIQGVSLVAVSIYYNYRLVLLIAMVSILFGLLLIRFRGGFLPVAVWCPICHNWSYRNAVDDDMEKSEFEVCAVCDCFGE